MSNELKKDIVHPEDEMWVRWQEAAPRIYDKIYYQSNPIVSRVNRYGHVAVEKPFSSGDHFSRVLEIGCGDGQHLDYVKHGYDEYVMTDLHPGLLGVAQKRHAGKPQLSFEVQNALSLEYETASFDRLVSIYNLEHLPDPHIALKEWRRVVKKGGTLSISIPTEGGIAWNLGRYLTTRRSFAKQGLDLDYIIAREHINTCYRMVSLIRYYFPKAQESWYPFRIPSAHVNLVYSCTIRNE